MNKWKTLLACGALCVASSAFAGGPEMPPPGHSAVFIGIGGAFDYAQGQVVAGGNAFADPLINAQFEFSNSNFGLAPAGQLGYEYFFGSGGFFGIKGVYYYTNKNFANHQTIDDIQGLLEFQSMVQAMLEGGICVNNNAIYLEAGYAALFTHGVVRDIFPAAGVVVGSHYDTLNGGVAGIGFRHYFWDVISIDAVYSYALFADGDTVSGALVSDPTIRGYAQLKRVSVQDILFTVNYNFNF